MRPTWSYNRQELAHSILPLIKVIESSQSLRYVAMPCYGSSKTHRFLFRPKNIHLVCINIAGSSWLCFIWLSWKVSVIMGSSLLEIKTKCKLLHSHHIPIQHTWLDDKCKEHRQDSIWNMLSLRHTNRNGVWVHLDDGLGFVATTSCENLPPLVL